MKTDKSKGLWSLNPKERETAQGKAQLPGNGLFKQPITPGDWHFDEETLIVTAGKSPGQPYVADCRFGPLVHRAPNARLIASAPKLKAHADKLAEALRELSDQTQLARKYIVLDDDNGLAAYHATAKAWNEAREALAAYEDAQ